jgi:hypothetical protein
VAGLYEAWFQSPGLGPNWMHDPVGNAWWGAVGKVLDEQVARLKLAGAVRYPSGARAAGIADALDLQGADRLLPRGGTTPGATNETDAAYEGRLLDAWDAWATAGTPLGLLRALKAAGFPVEVTGAWSWTSGAFLANHLGRLCQLVDDELVIESAGECLNRQDLTGTVAGDLVGWTLDARDQFFSHFMLVFLEDVPTLLDTAGDPVKACLHQTVARWKQGNAIYDGCAILPQESDAKSWGFPIDLVWGATDLVWGTNNARFIHPEV